MFNQSYVHNAQRGSTITVRKKTSELSSRSKETIASIGLLGFQAPHLKQASSSFEERHAFPSHGRMLDNEESNKEEYSDSDEDERRYSSDDDNLEESGVVVAETQHLLDSQVSDITTTSTPNYQRACGSSFQQQRLQFQPPSGSDSTPRQYQRQQSSNIRRPSQQTPGNSNAPNPSQQSALNQTPHEVRVLHSNCNAPPSSQQSDMNNSSMASAATNTLRRSVQQSVINNNIRQQPQQTAGESRAFNNITNAPHPLQRVAVNNHSACIAEWDNCNPDFVMKRLKLITKEELASVGRREFYKSYVCWEKMTLDQRNKSLSWFRGLPDNLKGKY